MGRAVRPAGSTRHKHLSGLSIKPCLAEHRRKSGFDYRICKANHALTGQHSRSDRAANDCILVLDTSLLKCLAQSRFFVVRGYFFPDDHIRCLLHIVILVPVDRDLVAASISTPNSDIIHTLGATVSTCRDANTLRSIRLDFRGGLKDATGNAVRVLELRLAMVIRNRLMLPEARFCWRRCPCKYRSEGGVADTAELSVAAQFQNRTNGKSHCGNC